MLLELTGKIVASHLWCAYFSHIFDQTCFYHILIQSVAKIGCLNSYRRFTDAFLVSNRGVLVECINSFNSSWYNKCQHINDQTVELLK